MKPETKEVLQSAAIGGGAGVAMGGMFLAAAAAGIPLIVSNTILGGVGAVIAMKRANYHKAQSNKPLKRAMTEWISFTALGTATVLAGTHFNPAAQKRTDTTSVHSAITQTVEATPAPALKVR